MGVGVCKRYKVQYDVRFKWLRDLTRTDPFVHLYQKEKGTTNNRDMKTILIKLQYTTPSGFEWLEETVEVNEFNYIKVVGEYIKKNQQNASALETKWKSDGEEVELFLDVEPINTDFSNDLFKRVYTYVDNHS